MSGVRKSAALAAGACLCIAIFSQSAQAQTVPVRIGRIQDINSGDTAWMLVSCALVLMMTGPGLALFYGGLVRRKNVLATMMHCFILMGLVSVIWALVGYSLAFDVGRPWIGGLRFAFLREVGARLANMRRRFRTPPGWRFR
jgi:ammonium transporter, Amt family